MKMRYACQMDGVELDSLAPSIYITDVVEAAPTLDTSYVGIAKGGQRILRRLRTTSVVTVSFLIREYDVTRRKAVCQQVADWAQGTFLTINDRPGQRLRVVCSVLPVIRSALKWTDKLTMTFTAYEQPYWEDAIPNVARLTGSGNADLRFAGNVKDVPLWAEVTAKDAVTRVSIAVNGQTITLEGLGMATGDVLRIGYDDHGLQYIRVNEASRLHCRTVDSADDLLLQPMQTNSISLTADGSVSAAFSVRGRWL